MGDTLQTSDPTPLPQVSQGFQRRRRSIALQTAHCSMALGRGARKQRLAEGQADDKNVEIGWPGRGDLETVQKAPSLCLQQVTNRRKRSPAAVHSVKS